LTNVNEEGHLYGVHGSSGGYAETIFRYAAKTLFGREMEGPLEFRTIRNSDFQEVTLEVSPVLSNALHIACRHMERLLLETKLVNHFIRLKYLSNPEMGFRIWRAHWFKLFIDMNPIAL
jgi:hypothetical protein